jgi:hypothetical protein
VTQRGCLLSLLGVEDKGIEKVYGEEKNIFLLGPLDQPRQNKNLLYLNNKPTEGPPSFVPIHLSFNSQQEPPISIVSLVRTAKKEVCIFE